MTSTCASSRLVVRGRCFIALAFHLARSTVVLLSFDSFLSSSLLRTAANETVSLLMFSLILRNISEITCLSG